MLNADNELDLKFKTAHKSSEVNSLLFIHSRWFIDFNSFCLANFRSFFLPNCAKSENAFRVARLHIQLLITCEFESIMRKVNCVGAIRLCKSFFFKLSTRWNYCSMIAPTTRRLDSEYQIYLLKHFTSQVWKLHVAARWINRVSVLYDRSDSSLTKSFQSWIPFRVDAPRALKNAYQFAFSQLERF